MQLKALRFGSRNKLKDDQDAGCGRFVLLVIIGVRVYARFLSDTLGCTGILLQHIP